MPKLKTSNYPCFCFDFGASDLLFIWVLPFVFWNFHMTICQIN